MLKKLNSVIFLLLFFIGVITAPKTTLDFFVGDTYEDSTPQESISFEVIEIDSKVTLEFSDEVDSSRSYSVDDISNLHDDFTLEILKIDQENQTVRIEIEKKEYYNMKIETGSWCVGDTSTFRFWREDIYDDRRGVQKEFERKYEDLQNDYEKHIEDGDNSEANDVRDEIDDLIIEYFGDLEDIKIEIYDGPFESSGLLAEKQLNKYGEVNLTFSKKGVFLIKAEEQNNFYSYKESFPITCSNEVEQVDTKEEVLQDENNGENTVLKLEGESNLGNQVLEFEENPNLKSDEEDEIFDNQLENLKQESEKKEESNFLIYIFFGIITIISILSSFIFLYKSSQNKKKQNDKTNDINEVKEEAKQNAMEQNVKDYILKYKDFYPIDSIREVLKEQGINDEMIDKILKEIN